MSVLICDPIDSARLITERQQNKLDRFDEVWEGVYVMAPLANNEHQFLGTCLGGVLLQVISYPEEGTIFVGCNVSDRIDGWNLNYRIPDVAVFLKGNKAKDCITHWYGGPDWAAEILSPGDRSREKLDFYTAVGVRELLLIDRDPWSLELFKVRKGKLVSAATCTPDAVHELVSDVLPLSFKLDSGEARPSIEVTHNSDGRHWTI